MHTETAAKADCPVGMIPPAEPCMGWEVAKVRPLPGHRLLVGFLDGVFGLVDMSAMVASPDAGVFAALRDDAMFKQVHVFLGAVTWPGEIDLAPDAMHDEIVANGEWVLT